MQATKPDAWEYKEYDTNNNLRARHVWTFLPDDLKYFSNLKDVHHIVITPMYKNEAQSTFLPDDLKYFSNLKDVHHIVITPMYKNEAQSQEYNKENKYSSKKLAEAFGGL